MTRRSRHAEQTTPPTGACMAARRAADQAGRAREVRGAAAPDPVNLPDDPELDSRRHSATPNPRRWDARRGIVAPPAMIQVWTMPGLQPGRAGDHRRSTTCRGAGRGRLHRGGRDQLRADLPPLPEGSASSCPGRPGSPSLAGPKRTALGEGYFVTWNVTWYSGGRARGHDDFPDPEISPHEPASQAPPPPTRPRRPRAVPAAARRQRRTPPSSGTASRQGELRIQRCADCGELRHPPGPMCPACRSTNRDARRGERRRRGLQLRGAPPPAGAGTRAAVRRRAGGAAGGRADGRRTSRRPPDDVGIGMPVRVTFAQMDDELILPMWAPAGVVMRTLTEDEVEIGAVLPELVIDLTPTFVISTALATRDFTTVHHDVEGARGAGLEGHLPQHPDHDRPGRAVRHGLGGPDAVVRAHQHPARRPCYAGDTLTFTGTASRGEARRVHRRGPRPVSLGDHVSGTVDLASVILPATRRDRPIEERSSRAPSGAAIAGIGATEFSKDSGRSSCGSPPRRCSPRWTTPG